MDHIAFAGHQWAPLATGTYMGEAESHPGRPEPLGPTLWIAVRFAAGTRTNWHRHAAGQLLVVTEGTIVAGVDGQDPISAVVGDVIYTPAGQAHWHGAPASCPGSHLSFTFDELTEWENRTGG